MLPPKMSSVLGSVITRSGLEEILYPKRVDPKYPGCKFVFQASCDFLFTLLSVIKSKVSASYRYGMNKLRHLEYYCLIFLGPSIYHLKK